MAIRETDKISRHEHWEASYQKAPSPSSPVPNARQLMHRILSEKAIDLFRDYQEWLLFEVVYEKYLPRGDGLRVLEIGSAPGTHLIALHRKFNYEPFGIEYTHSGAERNRRLFLSEGIDPENVIEADVFSPQFLQRYKESFDVVVSRGFLEHFKNPHEVIETHLTLLRNGGSLIVSVPNFRGIYYPWFSIFRRSVLTWHNFEVMRSRTFQELFNLSTLERKYCGPHGIISLDMFIMPQNLMGNLLGQVRSPVQSLINFALHTFFKNGGPESALLSPHWLCIAEKRKAR